MQKKNRSSGLLTNAILLSILWAGTVSADELTKREYARTQHQKGVVLLSVNWGRAWNYCGFENVQLQSLSFDRMPIQYSGDAPPGDLNLKGAKLAAKPVSVDYALHLDPGEYALTAFHIKAAKSVNDVGAFQTGRTELIEDGKALAGSFKVDAGEIVYVGHFAPDCPEQNNPVIRRYYLKDVAAFKEYLVNVQDKFPFLDTRTAQFRLFQTTTIGDEFELLDAVSTLARNVEEITAPLVAAREFSGAIVLMRHGEVLYQNGFGMANHEAGTAFTPETASDGGSLAKTFTAAGLQWLSYEGRVDLDAPVSQYLPEYPHAETTVRHLISHSNGLPPYYEYFDNFFEPDEVRTTEAMLRVIAREVPTPAFIPGSRFEYSNFAFDLAALMIERVSGQSYEAFLGERFFSRLGMQTSFARPARLADWQGVRTLGYGWRDNAWDLVDVFDMEAFLGASNLYFSALDLGRWASANAAGTAIPAGVFAAGQRSFFIGGQPSSITGLSWYCDEDGARCYYTGDSNAFHGFVYWDRQRDEAAVFVSNSSLPPWQIITLQRELVDSLAGRSLAADPAIQFERFDETTLPGLAGTYVSADVGRVQISEGDDGVRMRIGAGLLFDVFPVGPEIFYVPGPDYWLAFSGGQIPTRVHIRSMFLDTVATRSQ